MATDWQNFQDWVNSGAGWVFYFVVILAILVILLYFLGRRALRAPVSEHHSETSLPQAEREATGSRRRPT
jgi:hypothetical protein